MIVNSITPNYVQNYQYNSRKAQSVAFTGVSDSDINQINNGIIPDVDSLLSAMKGTFGYKSNDVESVVKALVDLASKRAKSIEDLQAELAATQDKLEVEKQNVQKAFDASEANSRRCVEILRAKDVELAAKDAEIERLKEENAKYKPMCSVRSVDELDTVMPEQAMSTLNEMLENRSKAAESLVEFLFTGKGQEEFLAQMDRNVKILKAKDDGVTNDPNVKKVLDKLSKREVYAGSHQVIFVRDAIDLALRTSKDRAKLSSESAREQVKKNAMALLAPVADEQYDNTNLKSCERSLDELLDKVVKFHNNVLKGKERYIRDFERSNFKYTEVNVPGSLYESGFKVTERDGKAYDDFINLWQIYNRGNS